MLKKRYATVFRPVNGYFKKGEYFMERSEWLKNRRAGIGSSDAAAVHGLSPYSTAYELWQEKTSTDITEEPSSFVMSKGNEFEPIARAKFAALHNIENFTEETFEPANLEMASLPFMKASLDGWSSDKRIVVEFKYQGVAEHARTGDSTLTVKERVRLHYWIQVQHQLLVSGADFAWFVSYNGESLTMVKIEPDLEFMRLHLTKCETFWTLVEAKVPPPLTLDDYSSLKAKGATALVREWKETSNPEIAKK